MLTQCLTVLVICGALDRIDSLGREVTELTDRLDNQILRATHAGSLMPVIHFIDPEGARDYLLRAYALNTEIGNVHSNCGVTMFLALHDLRAGDTLAAAEWARTSLQLSIDHGPSYIGQTLDLIVGIVKRPSPARAATLLGALRTHRMRNDQVGTQIEIDAEVRYEASLRRALGDEFDARATAKDSRSTRLPCWRSRSNSWPRSSSLLTFRLSRARTSIRDAGTRVRSSRSVRRG